ncbi:unnamed protein product [Mytilus coruscus]|uniref:Uncharacterized protein n=1 Tax=Mytilus coruscus TaxID=42192 RepID=A0A6J8F3T7_MYTCO|nr:unnamed protein product [Mytilus coruscus]
MSFTSLASIIAHVLFRRALEQNTKRLQLKPKIQHKIKFSSNGISKRRVKAPMSIFRQVLKTQRVGCGSIQGSRARKNGIYTYHQTRNGFSYFYCKRKELNDGMSTVPLDLELCPIPLEKDDEETSDDSNKDDTSIQTVDDETFVRWMGYKFRNNDEKPSESKNRRDPVNKMVFFHSRSFRNQEKETKIIGQSKDQTEGTHRQYGSTKTFDCIWIKCRNLVFLFVITK